MQESPCLLRVDSRPTASTRLIIDGHVIRPADLAQRKNVLTPLRLVVTDDTLLALDHSEAEAVSSTRDRRFASAI